MTFSADPAPSFAEEGWAKRIRLMYNAA